MATSITNLALLTETDAVNEMLRAIGEQPIADVDTSTQADVELAVDILRKVTADIQAEGWAFNTDLGLELSPDGTHVWNNPDGTTTTLNVFVPPTNYVTWNLTRNNDQLGLQISLRPPKEYTADLVFYDRILNRDGLDEDDYDTLSIDVRYLFDFEEMPQTARVYATALAARQFAEPTVGTQNLVRFTNDDLLRARRALVRDQGLEETANIFDSLESQEILGHRARGWGGIVRDYDNY